MLGLLGKEEKPLGVAILLRGVGAGWLTVFCIFTFKIVLKTLQPAVSILEQFTLGLKNGNIPTTLFAKGREGLQQQ